jgi:hypothetical protein
MANANGKCATPPRVIPSAPVSFRALRLRSGQAPSRNLDRRTRNEVRHAPSSWERVVSCFTPKGWHAIARGETPGTGWAIFIRLEGVCGGGCLTALRVRRSRFLDGACPERSRRARNDTEALVTTRGGVAYFPFALAMTHPSRWI